MCTQEHPQTVKHGCCPITSLILGGCVCLGVSKIKYIGCRAVQDLWVWHIFFSCWSCWQLNKHIVDNPINPHIVYVQKCSKISKKKWSLSWIKLSIEENKIKNSKILSKLHFWLVLWGKIKVDSTAKWGITQNWAHGPTSAGKILNVQQFSETTMLLWKWRGHTVTEQRVQQSIFGFLLWIPLSTFPKVTHMSPCTIHAEWDYCVQRKGWNTYQMSVFVAVTERVVAEKCTF